MQEVTFEESANKSLGDKAKELAVTVIGMTVEAAIKTIADAECDHRIAESNGKGSAMTMDYQFDRVNLAVDGDLVTAAKVG